MMQVDFYLQHSKYFGEKDYKKITSRIEDQTHIWQCKKKGLDDNIFVQKNFKFFQDINS
jgi:hypothetical protein